MASEESMSDWVGALSEDSTVERSSENVAVIDGMSTSWDDIRLSPLPTKAVEDRVPSFQALPSTSLTKPVDEISPEVAAELSYLRDKIYDIKHSHVQVNRSTINELTSLKSELRSLTKANRILRKEAPRVRQRSTRNIVVLTMFATFIASFILFHATRSDLQQVNAVH